MKKNILWILAVLLVVMLGGCRREQQAPPPAVEEEAGVQIYWNVDYFSYQSETGMTRIKNGDYYRATFAVNGEQIDLFFDNYATLEYADTMLYMGLEIDENNVVQKVLKIDEFTGGLACLNAYVESMDGETVLCNTSLNFRELPIKLKLREDTGIYYMDDDGGPLVGMPTQLQRGSRVTAIQDQQGYTICIYAEPPFEEKPVYYIKGRMYDSATKIDQVATKAVGLKVNGAVITKVYADSKVAGYTGGRKAAWYTLTAMEGNKLTAENKNVNDSDYGWIYNGTMTATCPVYNCSTAFVNYRGEKTQLKLGDTIMCMQDSGGKVVLVYVVGRKDDVPIYWNVEKMWDGTTSTRTPDEDGWYWFTMAIDGQHVKLKTNDRTIVDTIDGRAVDCIGLVTDGDRITRTVMPWKAEATIGGDFGSWTNVIELGENGLVKTIKVSNGSDNGKLFTGTMDEKTQVFDVSAGAALEGELSSLRLGDLIHGLADKNGNPRIIYIISRTEAHGSNHCACGGTLDAHAQQMHNAADGSCTVQQWLPVASQSQWKAYTVTGKLNNNRCFEGENVYIYLSADVTMSNILEVYPGQTVNICLNGHSLQTVSGQRFGNVAGGTLNICDCAGGGKVLSSYSTVLYAYADGKINLYGGTITSSVTTTTQRWGLIYLGNDAVSSMGLTATKSDMAIYGGCVDASGLSMDKVCDAASGKDSMGGAIWGFASTTSLTIHGGTVKGGAITSKAYGSGSGGTYVKGGAVALTGGSTTFTMTGGEIIGGNVPYGRGGAVYVAGKNNSITGGKISGGNAAYGGSVFSYGNDLTIGGTAIIENGVASSGGGTVYIFAGSLTVADQAQIRGGSTTGTVSGGNIFLRWGSGAAMTVNGGTVSGGTAGANAAGECGNIYVGYQATLTINDGNITGGRGKNGGNICSYGNIVMNGGSISGGIASGYGGNVSLYMDTETNLPATLTVNGGSIVDGSAAYGGNIRMGKNCTVTLAGGTVSGGTASANGGNIWVGNAVTKNGTTCYCTLNLQSGTVSGGTATLGSGVYAAATAVIEDSGNVIVADNELYQETA